MSNIYNLDGIKTELKKTIDRKKVLLEAWENVKFPTKKDGTAFKVMSKNIENATYFKPEHTLQSGENALRVIGWSTIVGYVKSEIDCYCLVKYLKDEKMLAKTENYQPKQSYLEQVYTYDIEDIKFAVNNKIEHLKSSILHHEKQLKKVDVAFNNFREAYASALAQLEIDTDKQDNSELYYMIKDTVKDRFPYC